MTIVGEHSKMLNEAFNDIINREAENTKLKEERDAYKKLYEEAIKKQGQILKIILSKDIEWKKI